MKTLYRSSLVATLLMFSGQAMAACPQALAAYEADDGKAGLEFLANSEAIAMSHEAKMFFGDEQMVVFGGLTVEPEQTFFSVQHKCPEGDVTGEELDQCIIYESIVYAVSAEGVIGDMPSVDEPAANKILLPGFLQSVAVKANRLGIAAQSAAEVFTLSGCQE